MPDQLIGYVLLILAAGGVVGIILSMFRRWRHR